MDVQLSSVDGPICDMVLRLVSVIFVDFLIANSNSSYLLFEFEMCFFTRNRSRVCGAFPSGYVNGDEGEEHLYIYIYIYMRARVFHHIYFLNN
jgi:hypothetical protein